MSEAPDNRRIEVGAAGLSRRALGGAAGGAMLAALGLSPASAARNRKRNTAGRPRLQQAEYVFALAWGDTGDEPGEFRDPRAITVFPETGDVFVADTGNNRVQKFTGDGTFVTQWGSYGRRNGQFNEPNGIAFDPSGAIYVADSENERIQKFSNDGAFVTAWGRPGRGNGQFSEPYGISAGTSGAIYVTDVGLNRIQFFTNT